ncbi:MAG TPA: ABC transporter ATP-binding protein, partial [Marinobacter sp.]|nr:ABC transporter ATP-binding protein [Marinobacter sp.]
MSFLSELADREQVFTFLTPTDSPVDVRHGPILYLEDVNVSFDGFKAINNLNLTIDDGELRCIIGP